MALLAASMIAWDVTLPAAVAAPAVKRLAIYYGYPTLVENSRGDITRAAAVFAQYDVIVFGDGLELPESETAAPGLKAERERLPALIQALHASPRKPQVYGYIDLGSTQQLTIAEIDRRVERWRVVGADGVFFDEAGNDFGVDPPRRRAAVCAVHRRGLSVFLNAFNPDDLFTSPAEARQRRERAEAGDCDGQLGPRDALLIESFAVRNGDFEPVSRIEARAAAALTWRQRYGVRVFAVTTTDGRPFSREQFNSAWQHAATRGLDGFGWGEKDFSADSRLPWRGQP